MDQQHCRVGVVACLLVMHGHAVDLGKARVIDMKNQLAILFPVNIARPREQLCGYRRGDQARGAGDPVTFLHTVSHWDGRPARLTQNRSIAIVWLKLESI